MWTRPLQCVVLSAGWLALQPGCSGHVENDEDPGAAMAPSEGASGPVAAAQLRDGLAELTSDPEAAAPIQEVEAEVRRSLPKPDGRSMSLAGGTLSAGGFKATVSGLPEPLEVELVPLATDQILEPRPLSTVLAAAELRPMFTVTEEMTDLTFPLHPALPPGESVQLLAFNRSMDAFLVVANGRVQSGGIAQFRTDVFSQYLVIATPELDMTGCTGGPLDIRQSVPDGQERDLIGQVPEDRRLGRATAFAVLTDLRAYPGAQHIVFKNEERRHTPPTTVGEDYLVDPRLVTPLLQLGHSVLEQWVDPISGGPAMQLRVTDAYDSLIEHSPESNHYRGLAADLTLSPVPGADQDTRAEVYGRLARLAVCAGFDFVHFENRHHVHVASQSGLGANRNPGVVGER